MISRQKMRSTPADSVLSRFIERSTERPNSPAIFIGDRLYTYAELNSLSSAVHALLQANHVKRGDRVGILTENNIYTYASVLGILSCGACYVPLNYENPIERNREIAAEADINLVLYAEKEYEARQLSVSTGANCRRITNELAGPGPIVSVDQTETDLCYLLFTSGTTGKPKGVPIYHRNVSAFLHMMLESGRYDFNSNDRFLQMFELTFDMSVFSFLIPLSVGATLYPVRRKRMASYLDVAETLEARDITVAFMVPSVINYLKPYFAELCFPKLRYSLFAGEALYHETLCGWAQCVPSAKIENLYGPTEATIVCMRYEWQRGEPPHPQGKGIVPIGKPMEGMDAFKANEAKADEEGELCLSGDQVTIGYWKNPLKTAESFGTTDDGRTFYRTGDLCKTDHAGHFLYLGRIDNQVKIDGHRVELEEIEFHARAFCKDSQVVAAVGSDAGLHFIFLFIEDEEDRRHGLDEYLKSHLPSYMIPKEIIPINLFPLNSNGKIDRKALIQKYLQEVNERATRPHPTS